MWKWPMNVLVVDKHRRGILTWANQSAMALVIHRNPSWTTLITKRSTSAFSLRCHCYVHLFSLFLFYATLPSYLAHIFVDFPLSFVFVCLFVCFALFSDFSLSQGWFLWNPTLFHWFWLKLQSISGWDELDFWSLNDRMYLLFPDFWFFVWLG